MLAASASYSVNGTEAPPLTSKGETLDVLGAAVAEVVVIAKAARPPAATAAAVAEASQSDERRLMSMGWGVPFWRVSLM